MSNDAGVSAELEPRVRVVLLTRAGCVACEAAARALDGMGLNSTGLDGTGLESTGLDGTGLDATGLDGTGLDGRGTGHGWSAVDVDAEAARGDPELRVEYGDRLPVVLLDGREHSYGEVDEERLRTDLRR